MADAKAALAVGGIINQPHHRRIGRDEDAASVFLSVTRFTGDESGRWC